MSVVIVNSGSSPRRDDLHELTRTNVVDKRIFVVHRHPGPFLHYTFRVEIAGSLKNWALPSGPSMNCDDRRLAVMTADKPLSFADTRYAKRASDEVIENWDRGTIIPHSIYSSGCSDREILEQITEGRFRFTLKGKKLKGVFSLVRLNGSDSVNWLLLKGNDRFSVDYRYNPEDYLNVRSAAERRQPYTMYGAQGLI